MFNVLGYYNYLEQENWNKVKIQWPRNHSNQLKNRKSMLNKHRIFSSTTRLVL